MKLLNSWFDEIFIGKSKSFILPHCASVISAASSTVWKNEKFSLTEKKIRQMNHIVIFSKTLLSRYFCEKGVRENICNFHTVSSWAIFVSHTVEFTKFLYHLKNISWNQLFSKLFTKEIVFTEIFQKVVIQKFRKIHSVYQKPL